MSARIITSYDRPPIPTTAFDWSAVRDGYDGGDPIGHGPTEDAAIADLLEQERDRDYCPHGHVAPEFCTPCMEARSARIAEALAADASYLLHSRRPFVPYLTPRDDFMRAHPDRLPPPNRGNE